MIPTIRIIRASDRAAMAQLVAADQSRNPRIRRETALIVRDVIRRGDVALNSWRWRLDRQRGPIELSPRDIREGCDATPKAVRQAIRHAIRNARSVASQQRPREWSLTVEAGVRIEQRVEAIDSVACYVPGGRHPLPSTVVMTVVPAQTAGVPEIIVACPQPVPSVLFAAAEAGATRVFRMGGAHAIAALAAGTQSVPRVAKIVGPGNAWVTAAKDLVAFDGLCAIDMHAGPSEIGVYSNKGPARWIAADLIAQAEHDPSARAVFVTRRPKLAAEVRLAIDAEAPATGPARAALRDRGAIIVARTDREALESLRRLALEHVVCDRVEDARKIGPAGTVFAGKFSAQAAGDYCTGSNHVLPTGGAARTRGGLSVADFVRVLTVQRLTRAGLRRIGPDAVRLAIAEGLDAHAASIGIRLGDAS